MIRNKNKNQLEVKIAVHAEDTREQNQDSQYGSNTWSVSAI